MLPFKKNSNQETEIYFAVEINSEIVKAATWEIAQNQIKVEKTSEAISIENNKKESILNAVDMAIATVSDNLEKDPDKVIFGLTKEWIDENGIKTENRKTLKYICQKLEFKPLGFVVIQDALVTYLRNIQGTPANTIFIRFFQKQLVLTFVRLGKIEKQVSVNRSSDIISDVKEGLAQFKQFSQFPSQITLYNSHTDFEDIRQELLAASLEEDFPFLHTPKIDFLQPEDSIKAVAIAGGGEVAKTLLTQEINSEDETENPVAKKQSQALEKEKKSDQEELPEGFVLEEPEEKPEKTEETKKASLPPSSETNSKLTQQSIELPASSQSKSQSKLKFLVSKAFQIIKKLPKKILPKKSSKTLPIPDKAPPQIKIWMIAVFIFLLLGSAIFYTNWFYHNKTKAQIDLFLTPQDIKKQLEITSSLDLKSLDLDQKIVPAAYQTVTQNGSETIKVTGTKRIGEKSSGTVTIFNKTENAKKFVKNTILVGPENLRFILTQDIEVASKSAVETDGGEQVTYGSAEVSIKAGDIGEEYNLSADSQFSFKDFSSDKYDAKAKTEISGGTSQEIQIVSQEDLDNAQSKLQEKLTSQAQEKLKTDNNELIIFKDIIIANLSNTEFNHELEEEADSLTITGELQLKILSASQKDFNTILQKALASEIPDKYVVSPQGLSHEIISFKEAEKSEDIYIFKISAQAKILPKNDITEIKKSIAGKSPQKAEEYFQNLPNYARTKISISPVLPGKLGTLPPKSENISLNIQSE